MEHPKFPFIKKTTYDTRSCGLCQRYHEPWTTKFCRKCHTPYCCNQLWGIPNSKRKNGLCIRCKEQILGRPVQCDIDHVCRNPDCSKKTRFCKDKRVPGLYYEKGLTWRNKKKLPEELRDFCRICLFDRGYIFHDKNLEIPKKNKKCRSNAIMAIFMLGLDCDSPILESLFHAKIGYRKKSEKTPKLSKLSVN